MNHSREIYLLLGTNLGDRIKNLKGAIDLLEKNNIQVIKVSSVYETAAWGKTDQQAFLNQVLRVESELRAEDLLYIILDIEKTLGRIRKEKWGERLIDIDILFYDKEVIKSQRLVIPHPFLHERRFTLVPLVEIAPNFIHPILNKSSKELLKLCPDKLEVSLLEN